MKEVVKIDADTTVMIEPGCNTRILTLEDDPCIFQQVPPGGIDGGEAQGVASGGGIAAVILGVALACAVVVCLVLLVALWMSKRERR